ncbi:MAG: pentapeptide repeat-containing protein, partial [Planctomycetales bacterium]|nr:pentapeptide repeat-containing protein [Planctomycetales bacterium]
NLSEAIIARASLRNTTPLGFTKEQLYATASYQAKELRGVDFGSNDLSGWNFREQGLLEASFVGTNLTDSDFRHADLRNANLSFATDGLPYGPPAILDNAHFVSADLRGAAISDPTFAETTNALLPDGAVQGLRLPRDQYLVVRNYVGLSRDDLELTSVIIQTEMVIESGGALKLVFDADRWNSLITFDEGIPVTLDGTLDLTFADDVDINSQLGRTWKIFDWTGVAPEGEFSVYSHYDWDLASLYTSGEVTLIGVPTILPGDYNHNGVVDAADYTVWKDRFGSAMALDADGNQDGAIDAADYTIWKDNYGLTSITAMSSAVSEPSGALLAASTALLLLKRRIAVDVG